MLKEKTQRNLNNYQKNTGGYDNKYAIYRRNRVVPDMFDAVDISSMSACELIDTLERTAVYRKVGG